jgi:3'-phosphoadenosine 5'-phosphosulfate sulfotransferase (PAPS reductase)/FAD synthetase
MPGFSILDAHPKAALGFSGGKDSTAVLTMLRRAGLLDRVTVYHLDTGDLLPEMVEHVARQAEGVPHYVRIETDVLGWQAANGLPSDLVPHTQHWVGQAMGEGRGARIVARYDCCWANLMQPFHSRVAADGCTLLMRGTKRADMKKLPMRSGDGAEGMELFYPLEDWSHADVRAYLDAEGVTLPPMYQRMVNAPECARCSAWWGEGRGAYLAEKYPALNADYAARLWTVMNEIGVSAAPLDAELAACGLKPHRGTHVNSTDAPA